MAIEHPHWLLFVPRPRLPDDDQPYARRWWALPAVALCVFVIGIDVSIVGIAGPSLTTELGVSAAELQWTFDSFTVVLAGFVLIGGGLAERYGRKGVLQVGLSVFIVGSLIAAFAGEPPILIAGRAVTGLGAAMVFPPALSVLSVLFPEDERPRAVGIWAGVAASGMALGPIVGGVLLDFFWVGSVFLVNVPVAAVAIVYLAVVLPPSRGSEQGRLDLVGAVLSLLALGGLVYGIIEGPDQGWTDPAVLVAFVVGVATLAGFVAWELRIAHPLFDVRVLSIAAVVTGALAMAMVYLTMQGIELLVPQYLQYVEGYSTVVAGVVMLPIGAGLAVLSPHSARLVERYGQRTMLAATLGLMAAGLAVLALLSVWGGVVNVIVGLTVFAIGFGLVVAPATSSIMVALPVSKAGDGASVNLVSRQVGGAIGIALIGTTATVAYRADLSLSGMGLSADQQAQVESSLSGVETVSGGLSSATTSAVDAAADAAMAVGLQWGMALAALFAAISAVLAHRFLRPTAAPASAA
jgi:EmrB/QacA subfamily drug resistance transporter